MTVSEFFTKYNGRGIDFDGYYGFQCMDLWQQYNKEVVGGPRIAAPYAKDVWAKNLYPKDFYTKIANTPNGVPQKGDVIIWSGAANGGFGHIAVYYDGNVWNFRSFDQNWPTGSWCHFQPHNYNYVYGWLRPKKATPPAPIGDDGLLLKVQQVMNGGGNSTEKIAKIREIVK